MGKKIRKKFGGHWLPSRRTTIALLSFVFLLLSLIGQIQANQSGGTYVLSLGQSASAFWQQYQHDPQHTGQSQYNGAGSNSTDWIFGPVGSISSSPVIGTDGAIYFTSSNMYLYALNPDGSLKWERFLGEMPYQPVMDYSGRVIVPTSAYIYTFSSDGSLAETPITVKYSNSTVTPAPNGDIYVDLGNGSTEMLSAAGAPIWSAKTSCVGSPIAIGAAGSSSDVFCISAKFANHLTAIGDSGGILWVTPTKSGLSTVSLTPVVSPATGDIYFDGPDGHLYGVTPSGAEIFSGIGSNITSMPVIGANGNVYVGGLYSVYEFSPSGLEIWQAPVSSPVQGLGLDSSENVYAIEKSSGLVVLTSYGTVKWRYALTHPGEESLVSLALGANGSIYFGSSCALCATQWGNFYSVGRPANQYPITFAESGLDTGTNWTVVLDGKTYFTSWRTNLISVSAGPHTWSALTTISALAGIRYVANPTNGNVTVTGSTLLTLNYSKQYEVQWGVNPLKAGSVNATAGWFDPGSKVSVAASTAIGYKFNSWGSSSNGLAISNYESNSTYVYVNGTGTLTANFYIGLELQAGSGGTIEYSSPPISGVVSSGEDEIVYVRPDSLVSLTPKSDSGYNLVSWSGVPQGNQPPLGSTLTLLISAPTNVSAIFRTSDNTIQNSGTQTTVSSIASTETVGGQSSIIQTSSNDSTGVSVDKLHVIDQSLIAMIVFVILVFIVVAVVRRHQRRHQ